MNIALGGSKIVIVKQSEEIKKKTPLLKKNTVA